MDNRTNFGYIKNEKSRAQGFVAISRKKQTKNCSIVFAYSYQDLQAIKIQNAFRGYFVRSIIEKCLDIDKMTPLRTIKNTLRRIDQEMRILLTPLLLDMKRFEY